MCPSSPSSPVNHTAKYHSHSELCKIQSSWLIKALFPSFPSTSLQKRGDWWPEMKNAACLRVFESSERFALEIIQSVKYLCTSQ